MMDRGEVLKSTLHFSELYSLFYKRLFLIGYSITRDKFLAEDVVQETFIKVFNKADTLEEEGKIGAWLSVIATRTAIDIARREKKNKAILMEREMLEFLGKETKETIEHAVEAGFLLEEIKNGIRKLSLEQQELLILRLLKGLKEDEIAHVLHLKPATVKTKIYRAKKKLKFLVMEARSA
jgi:RNA polymerase sigma factor (sigma-70 family)